MIKYLSILAFFDCYSKMEEANKRGGGELFKTETVFIPTYYTDRGHDDCCVSDSRTFFEHFLNSFSLWNLGFSIPQSYCQSRKPTHISQLISLWRPYDKLQRDFSSLQRVFQHSKKDLWWGWGGIQLKLQGMFLSPNWESSQEFKKVVLILRILWAMCFFSFCPQQTHNPCLEWSEDWIDF